MTLKCPAWPPNYFRMTSRLSPSDLLMTPKFFPRWPSNDLQISSERPPNGPQNDFRMNVGWHQPAFVTRRNALNVKAAMCNANSAGSSKQPLEASGSWGLSTKKSWFCSIHPLKLPKSGSGHERPPKVEYFTKNTCSGHPATPPTARWECFLRMWHQRWAIKTVARRGCRLKLVLYTS